MDNLSVSFDRLAEAKSNLAKTAADLQRLGNEELELVTCLDAPIRKLLILRTGKHHEDP